MKYNEKQIKAVGMELKQKYLNGETEAHEIVVTLVAMERSGRIDSNEIMIILKEVFIQNSEGIVRALQKAGSIIDKELIDSIISDAIV